MNSSRSSLPYSLPCCYLGCTQVHFLFSVCEEAWVQGYLPTIYAINSPLLFPPPLTSCYLPSLLSPSSSYLLLSIYLHYFPPPPTSCYLSTFITFLLLPPAIYLPSLRSSSSSYFLLSTFITFLLLLPPAIYLLSLLSSSSYLLQSVQSCRSSDAW